MLEENTPLISAFLKRFKATYNDKDHVQVNLKAFVPSSDKEKSKKKKKNEDEGESDAAKLMRLASGLSLQDVHSGPVKLGIPSVLEFLLDCYCGMWQSMIRCGNESMLTMMLRQVSKKKYSQKTNDFRTKSLLDSLMSPAGTEIPELMVFCNLVGILPKVSGKISAAWGHIATSLLAAIHCDRCLKTNTLVDPFGNPNVSEFRAKLAKSILFQGYNVSATVANSSKMIPLKKAFRIIHLLATNYQPSWIMAPITSACVEYQSRLPWSAPSVAKLFNILFYVALFEQTISSRLSAMQAENSMHSGSLEHSSSDPMAAGKVMGKMYEKAMQSTSKDMSGKMRLSQSLSQLPSVSNKVPFQQSPGGRRNTSLQMSVTETSATGASSTMNHRRTNIGLDQINIQRSMKNAGRLEMLKTIDTLIAKVWNTSMHPYLHLDTEKPTSSQMAMIHDMLIYLGDLDIAGSMQRTNKEGNMDAISEESSFASSSRRPTSHRHHHNHSGGHHAHQHHGHHHHLHHLHTSDEHEANDHPWSHLSPQEQPLHHIRMDVEQAMILSETLSISMYDFVLVTVRAWNCEYESIKADLQRIQLLKQRRQAITGHYDARQAKMTAQERLTITRLLQYYKRGEEFIGIDWDEVDEQADRHFFPFSLPKSLLSKSRNELQVLTDQVTQSLQAQSLQDNAYYGKRTTATLKQQTAHGTVASLIPHDHGVTAESGNESDEVDVDADMTMMKGISGGTAIQDNLPDDEIHLLVGQVSPRDTDEVMTTVEAPSVTSSVQLYMLASELERGMGYTNSVFPAFRKQELELEQSIRAGIAEDYDHFNHRHPNFHEESSWQEDDGSSDGSQGYDPEHAKNQWQRTKATTTAGFHADKHDALTKMHHQHRSHGVLPGVNNGSHMSSMEGSTSLSDVDGLLPPLDAPTLDPTLSSSHHGHGYGHGHSHHPPQATSYHQSQSNLKRVPLNDSTSTSLPDVVPQPNLTTIPKRLQSPANGGQRPPSGSLVRYNMDKKNQKKVPAPVASTTAAHQTSATRVSESGDVHMKRKPGETGVGTAPGKHINIVDMIDVDGEVLERSGLTPGLSANLRPAHGTGHKHHDGHVDIFEDTSLTTHPLEETISTFAPASSNRARSGSKLNRKPVHNVNVDIIEDKVTKKFTTKIVVEESFENSAFRPTRGGGGDGEDGEGEEDGDDGHDDGGVHFPPVLNLEERRKFTRARLLSVVDNIAQDYHTTLEHQKKARMSHVRTKVMQRSDNKDTANKSGNGSRPETTSRLAISVVAEKPFGSSATTATAAGSEVNSANQADAHHQPGSTDSLTAPGAATGGTRPQTSASTSSSTFAESQFLSRPFLDLSKGVRANGKFVVDLTDSLVAESAVTKLVLRDTKIVLPSFKLVIRTYCNPWQLESIRFMDLSGNPHCGGIMAAKVLGHSLSTYCQLVELNINHMKIGDSGLACLLQGMLQGHGHRFLQSLSLQYNDITMATSAIALLGHFQEIKSLDLSHNMFTLDTHAQTKYFTEAIEGLASLEVLSLAYNKIQDAGFALALDLLLGQVPLRVLDVAECFITNYSSDHVRMILESTPKQRDKRYTTTMSMTFQLDADANPGKPPMFRGLSRFLSTGRLGRSSMDLSGMDVPSNTRETSSAYQPTLVPIHLDHLFLQGSLIPQNGWVQLREAMLASTCKIYLHEEYAGIAQFPVIDMSKYNL